MPRFRFTGDARLTLPFRNGPCVTFDNVGGEDGWVWVAHKKDKPGPHVVLVRCANVRALHDALSVDGLEIPAGSVAERVMNAAVKCRFRRRATRRRAMGGEN